MLQRYYDVKNYFDNYYEFYRNRKGVYKRNLFSYFYNHLSIHNELDYLQYQNFYNIKSIRVSTISQFNFFKLKNSNTESIDLFAIKEVNFNGIEDLPKLTSLSLDDVENFVFIENIKLAKNIQKLAISFVDISEECLIDIIENLTHLKYLSLYKCNVTNIEFLKKLCKLQTVYIDIKHIDQILEIYNHLPHLTSLTFPGYTTNGDRINKEQQDKVAILQQHLPKCNVRVFY